MKKSSREQDPSQTSCVDSNPVTEGGVCAHHRTRGNPHWRAFGVHPRAEALHNPSRHPFTKSRPGTETATRDSSGRRGRQFSEQSEPHAEPTSAAPPEKAGARLSPLALTPTAHLLQRTGSQLAPVLPSHIHPTDSETEALCFAD